MPNKDASGNPYRSKIAAIQEYTNFPQAEHTLPREDIDLPERSGFGKHTLVGLNVFLLKMAWQFPDILGIRKSDPMLADIGHRSRSRRRKGRCSTRRPTRPRPSPSAFCRTRAARCDAQVKVTSKVGHKFPSGVGFRRAFIEFSVLDANGEMLWSSGQTNSMGVIVDRTRRATPIAGELWWKEDCSARIDPAARAHQPHYQVITRQDQAQIYQELVSTRPTPRRYPWQDCAARMPRRAASSPPASCRSAPR